MIATECLYSRFCAGGMTGDLAVIYMATGHRVSKEAHHKYRDGGQGCADDPNGGLFIVQHGLDSGCDAHFAEGKRTG
jgi:hypothetical protein